MSKRKTNDSGIGCLGFIICIVLLYFALTVYSYFWIPAIPVMIYFIKSKKFAGKRTKNVSISAIVLATSLAAFIYLNAPTKLTGIEVAWGNTEVTVGDTVELEMVAIPSDAELKKVEMPESDLVDFEFKDNKAVLTFKKPGQSDIYFTNGKDAKSPSKKFTIISKEEKQQREIAEQQAQEAAELAEQQAQEEAARQAELQAQQEAQAAEEARIAAEQEAAAQAQQQVQEEMVWISATGSKYHSSNSCGQMNPETSSQIPLTDAQAQGLEPCKRCH